ncbi:hypothetical protein RJ640_026317 [Escallonia rubra]|uniref:Dynamin-related protein 4C-like n=1 Tax=Escallonia rubra TaxID=112253 RepID=A0AA88R4C1_9ASTE|nr:hypothetical protein RJ640_026317 [Escallonia rubra]
MPRKSSSSKLRSADMEGDEKKNVGSLAHNLSVISFDASAPLVSSYNDRIRPLLDAVDELRRLKVMQEGIQLPTIVVVGDQSSGKSSVLESLAGISLPRGQGICTRVPLIMRLQNIPNHLLQPELHLEFHGKIIRTDEAHVSEAINLATDEIAGNGKGISQTPLTLVVKKNGVPDLTMVDLPGITRVPVHGQPQDIYEQISNIIMEYIKPDESIILNVLSATVDFPTCESIRMSQQVDKTGQRTLAVVTKADKAPEGLFEKVTSDDVNIGLGYVCVRNRIGEESYNEARKEEARLFEAHPLLARIDKNMVGVPVLAQRLVHVQAMIISKCLPDIVRKINDKLKVNLSELNRMPRNICSVAEAMTAYVQVIGLSKESLKKILMRGEFDEYPDDKEMHCTARLAELLNNYSELLQKSTVVDGTDGNFLMEEIRVLEETKAMWLPNFVPRTAFLAVLHRKVKEISNTPVEFIAKAWNYIEKVVTEVLSHHSDMYPQLHSSTRRAAQNLVAKTKDKSTERVREMVEMEKLSDYTCDPEYMTLWSKLMEKNNAFAEIMNDHSKPTKLNIEGFGDIEVGHLRAFPKDMRDQAFDMHMRITAYWKIVLKRLVDSMALHLLLSVRNLVGRDMEVEMVSEVMSPDHGGGIERMLEESPSVAKKRERLQKSVKLLKDSEKVIAMIMDKIAISAD